MATKTKTVHTVAIASYEFAGATAVVIAAVRKAAEAGTPSNEIAAEFRAGRIARAILTDAPKVTEAMRDKAIARGLAIVLACEPGRKPKQGQAMRSDEDQKLFEPTKRWWSRIGRDAGVIKPRAAKAKAEAPAKADKPGKTSKTLPDPFFAKAPKDNSAAILSVQNMLHAIATYCAKNHKRLPAAVVAKCNGLAVEVDKIAKEA